VKKILIVDDNPAVRRQLRTFLLRQSGEWEVCGEAENGKEGVEKARQLLPDLIILDLSMPVMNGLQAARELHRLMPEIPMVLFTTFDSQFLEREAKDAGIRALRSKSEGVDTLFTSIHGLLNHA
jgi:DNA-binding NarL/FixJ family response regulator